MTTRYDVIIIGSGAGGGTLACHLAPTGGLGCSALLPLTISFGH